MLKRMAKLVDKTNGFTPFHRMPVREEHMEVGRGRRSHQAQKTDQEEHFFHGSLSKCGQHFPGGSIQLQDQAIGHPGGFPLTLATQGQMGAKELTCDCERSHGSIRVKA